MDRAIAVSPHGYVTKPFGPRELHTAIRMALRRHQIEQSVHARLSRMDFNQPLDALQRSAPAPTVPSSQSPPAMAGNSPQIRIVREIMQELAAFDTTELIEGETGTGKELAARAIHDLSLRRDKPFLALNCAGLTVDLAASQSFRHRKGSYTEALRDHIGMFDAASGGTSFLYELGELPLGTQTSLLRVLEERAVMPVGDTQLKAVDVRVVAATNRNLTDEIVHGRLRKDLVYRFRVGRIMLPPLRYRGDDVLVLFDAFLKHYRDQFQKQVEGLDDEASMLVRRYPWPGNVGELKNAVEFAMVRLAATRSSLPTCRPR